MNRANIYIIYGASGSGKTTLISELTYLTTNVSIHTKGTTRKLREYDDSEVISVDDVSSTQYDYIYSNYGHKYGIQKNQIDTSLHNNRHHFIICNDKDTIQQIKNDYPNRVRVIYLSFDMPELILRQIQKERKISDDEVSLRLEKIKALNEEFLNDRSFFDAVIINKLGAPPTRMLTQLKSLIESESDDPTDTDIEKIKVELIALNEIIDQINKNTTPKISHLKDISEKDFVFIVMAMLDEDPLLVDVHECIKRACSTVKLNAQRVDDKYHGSEIPHKVLNNIKLASIIIADLTHARPNSYYELGYAHAYGKKVIITAREGTKVHFDVEAFERIIYKNTTELEKRLITILSDLNS